MLAVDLTFIFLRWESCTQTDELAGSPLAFYTEESWEECNLTPRRSGHVKKMVLLLLLLTCSRWEINPASIIIVINDDNDDYHQVLRPCRAPFSQMNRSYWGAWGWPLLLFSRHRLDCWPHLFVKHFFKRLEKLIANADATHSLSREFMFHYLNYSDKWDYQCMILCCSVAFITGFYGVPLAFPFWENES